MAILKTLEQIELIRESALLVSKTLGMLSYEIKPGINTLFLDKLAHNFILDHGAKPGFLNLYNFPNTLCISINEQVVHGLPSQRILKEGDIVSIDCGVLKNNYYGDHAYTFTVGEVSAEILQLVKVTLESLYLGINAFKWGQRIGDIGNAIQTYTESFGYGVVKELVGHGIGKKMHEPPHVPNYGKKNTGPKLKNGMVLAIEPMINMGSPKIIELDDKWTIATKDNKPSAHFEHNVALIGDKPNILSSFEYISPKYQYLK